MYNEQSLGVAAASLHNVCVPAASVGLTARQIKEKGEMAYMFVDGNFLAKISCFHNLQIMWAKGKRKYVVFIN